MRLCGLGWGIPRYDPALASGTELRTSYHPDEDKMLWQLERMRPEALDFDPKDFGWGTLQTYLTGAALWLAQSVGLTPPGWREAFRGALSPGFERVFVTGRLVSAILGLLTLPLVYVLARDRGGAVAGLAASLLLAVSPLHVVHSHFLTADVALAFWLTLSLWLAQRHLTAAGFAAGLALATKPSAAILVPVLMLVRGRRVAALAALLCGFLLGEPYALLAVGEWWQATSGRLLDLGGAPEAFAWVELLDRHLFAIVVYGIGPVSALLAGWGLVRSGRLLVSFAALSLVSLGLSRFPMARYALPLLPVLCVAAGCCLATLPRRWALLGGSLAAAPALALCASQVGLMERPHTAQLAADWITRHVPAGSRIAQLWHDYPVLDRKRYRVSLLADPFALEGRAYLQPEADYVVLDDLPLHPFRVELGAALAREYDTLSVFEERPRLGPWVLPEPAPPHDWKYTHPRIALLRRREPRLP